MALLLNDSRISISVRQLSKTCYDLHKYRRSGIFGPLLDLFMSSFIRQGRTYQFPFELQLKNIRKSDCRKCCFITVFVVLYMCELVITFHWR